jgi:hypothetical protein
MKYTILVYVLVGVVATWIARFNANVYSWFLVLEFCVGLTQIIGSIIKFISYTVKDKSQDRKILYKYWLIVGIYIILALLASHYYEAHITHPMFDATISYNIVILSLAWPIAFWYVFNISFLKLKKP